MATELADILAHVGDTGDLQEYRRLKNKTNRNFYDNYRLRVIELPFPLQSATRRVLGLAAIGAATYFTATQGTETFHHYQTMANAYGDIQTTLHNINIFNAFPSSQHIVNDFQTIQNNILPGTVSAAKTLIGFNADIAAAVVFQPWRKSKRRGLILGAL